MGSLLCCCSQDSSSEAELIQPDPETRRRQMAEAAERRAAENQGRGVKNPSLLLEKQKRLEALEKKADEAARHGEGGPGLKWTVR